MIPLDKDLQKVKSTIVEFGEITERILQYLPNVLSSSVEKNDYLIYLSEIAGTTKYVRPINKNLFLNNLNDFKSNFNKLKTIF